MALAPIVFTAMGALGLFAYMALPQRRHKQSNKAVIYYLTSIFSLWLGYQIVENSNIFIKIIAFFLLLGGIYGFLFFGINLFSTVIEDKNDISSPRNSNSNSNSNLRSASNKNSDFKQISNQKIHDPNVLYHEPGKKGKVWYIFENRIYCKTRPYESYSFKLTSDGRKYKTIKNDLYPHEFFIDKNDIEEIKYVDGKVIIECPYCCQKCRCQILNEIEVNCPSCKNTWRRKLK